MWEYKRHSVTDVIPVVVNMAHKTLHDLAPAFPSTFTSHHFLLPNVKF